MSPILLGLAVTWRRVRQRPVSSANPRSPRQRSERWMALRVRLLMSSSPLVPLQNSVQGL
jgi:hypothetical protein